jgi:hypothetical protein
MRWLDVSFVLFYKQFPPSLRELPIGITQLDSVQTQCR